VLNAYPTVQSGGTSEMPMLVPAAVEVTSLVENIVAYAPASAHAAATNRSIRLGAVRAASSPVSSWNGSVDEIAVDAATTTMMLATERNPARKTSGADPVASPIASSTIGLISGAINIAPITTAVLSRASPSVASAVAIMSWSQ
jgi:hypothetical protein